ncbi:MAG: methyl-accepting chemotaxis protein [Gammaproteobacteria bacterium]|nr:methyl-accepting chemotaxis protein [Gammaproteobacteria bacterium]
MSDTLNTAPSLPVGNNETDRKSRRRYIIDKKSQLRIAGDMMSIMLIGGMLALLNVYYINSMLYLGSIGQDSYGLLKTDSTAHLWVFIGVLIVFSLAVIFMLSLLFSHRIAGPAYRIVKRLEAINAGDLDSPTNLRKTDHLQDVAGALNDTVGGWRETLQSAEEQIQTLKAEAAQLDEQGLQQRLSALQELLKAQATPQPDSSQTN